MIHRRFLFPGACAIALLAMAGGAGAQGVMPQGRMPPPPSASDPLPKSTTEKSRPARKPRAAAEAKPDDMFAEPKPRAKARANSGSPSYSERIDTRPGSGQLQLEDDPRAVQPILQNGRPGMGMRF